MILPRQNIFESHAFYVKCHIITLPAKNIKVLGVALQGSDRKNTAGIVSYDGSCG